MLKNYFLLSCILTCLLNSCKKDDEGSGSGSFRLRMVLSETSKTVYTYDNNKVDSVYNYTKDFGMWNMKSIASYEYVGTNEVSVKQVSYIGNMITGGSIIAYEFLNNKIINRSGNSGINQSFKYDGDLLVEVCDTPTLLKIEYTNKLVSKMSGHSFNSNTREFIVNNEFYFNHSNEKIEIVNFSINSKGDRKILSRRIKYLQNKLVVKEDYYQIISSTDSTKTTSNFTYDNKGNLVKIAYVYEDGAIYTTDYLYDEFNNQIERINTSSTGEKTHTYYYYESGSSNLKQFDFPKIKYVDFYVRELNFNSY